MHRIDAARAPLGLALLLAFGAAVAGQNDGRYVGPGRGTSKRSGSTCSEMQAEVTIRADGSIDGVAKRTAITNRVVTPERHQLSGKLAPDGTATLSLFNRPLEIRIVDGRLIGRYVGPSCDYDFDLSRVQ
jgi:hypothetical protein